MGIIKNSVFAFATTLALQSSVQAAFQEPHVIKDKFETLEQVKDALRKEGLESSDLIIGVDFTGSNQVQGRHTFNGRCLHEISRHNQNPYQAAIKIISSSLQEFDDDDIYPVYRFGDHETKGYRVLPLTSNMPEEGYEGFDDVMRAYSSAANTLTFSGPTTFVPMIKKAINIIKSKEENGQYPYHILLILTDGAINDDYQGNINAIVKASNYPLSIIAVGVGDGPWDKMIQFDDDIPKRKYDNFQFVEFHEQVRDLDHMDEGDEEDFATAALQEIPEQYQKIKELGLMNAKRPVYKTPYAQGRTSDTQGKQASKKSKKWWKFG